VNLFKQPRKFLGALRWSIILPPNGPLKSKGPDSCCSPSLGSCGVKLGGADGGCPWGPDGLPGPGPWGLCGLLGPGPWGPCGLLGPGPWGPCGLPGPGPWGGTNC